MKIYQLTHGSKKPWIPIFRIMKLTAILLFVSLIAMSAPTYSQYTKLNLTAKNSSLIDIFRQIEDQSEFYFYFKKEELKSKDLVSVEIKDAFVNEILDQVLAKTGLEYKIIDRYVVVKEKGTADPEITMQQQERKISGKVTEQSGASIPGASVVIKGTTTGVITNNNGNFSMSVPFDTKTLVFSFVGMKTLEIALGNQNTINVTMQQNVIGLDEIVAIGYGSQKRSSITGAISTMGGEDIVNMPVTSLSNALAGRLSGVFVNEASGAPGYAANIQVRSVNTWKSTGNDPLYVIDGIISTKQLFDALDATEIKNITVLKDAASTAVYGARGGNGVILVTTNTGEKGRFKFSYDYSYSFDEPTNIPKYVSSKDMVRLVDYAFEAIGQPDLFGPTEQAYFNTHDPGRASFTDLYRDPAVQKHSISASGGDEKIKYFLSGSYMGQDAFVKNADYKKYDFRSNISVNFTKNLSGNFNVSYHQATKSRFVMQEDNQAGFEEDLTFGTFWSRLQFYQPYCASKTSDGKLINLGWIGNAMGFVEQGGMNTARDYNINTVMNLTYKVPNVKGLSVSVNYSPQFYIRDIKDYEKKVTLYTVEQKGEHGLIYTDNVIGTVLSAWPDKERIAKTKDKNTAYQLNWSADYLRSFGKHNIGAMFNAEISESNRDYFYAVRENFPLVQRDQFWATGGSRADSYVDGTEYAAGRMSYIGRLTYQYSDKYFVNASMRRDGSMLFAPGYRWGNFPSVSLGWVLSNENFMKDKFFNYLKLRGTWGMTGNDVVGGWKWQDSYSTGGNVMIGTAMSPTVLYNGIVNEKLTWEKTREFNVGLDSRFWDGAIFNFEYYLRHNYDILDSRIVSLPASFGGTMPPVNYGIVDGHGLEVEVGYSGHTGKFNYQVKGNIAYARNKVVERDVAQNVRDVNNPNGRSTDYVACLVSKGIIRTQAQLDAIPANYTAYGLKPGLGDIWYQDVSGPTAGVPDGIIDDYDRQVIKGKHYTPPYVYGLNMTGYWKGFSLDLFLQGVTGVSKMYNGNSYGRHFEAWSRPNANWLDSWSPTNINASFPKPDIWGSAVNDVESTFWLKSGDYLRLKYLGLSYSLPESIIKKLNISKASVILSGTNLFTISGFKYYDPAIPSMGSYPTMKAYTLGINVSF